MKKNISISDHIVQKQWSENDILHRKCFDVNMRLFEASMGYKKVIRLVIEHMHDVITTNFSDYDTVVGISGANVGIPLNIVGLLVPGIQEVEETCNSAEGEIFFMINPRIVAKSKEVRTVKSNCGSIRLREKIEIERHEWVEVEFRDEEGRSRKEKFEGAFGSTLQHEIDHNMGILIVDKEKEKEAL